MNTFVYDFLTHYLISYYSFYRYTDIMNEIKNSTLKISGVFARMKGGLMTPDQAMLESLKLTQEIDTSASTLEDSNRNLRKSYACLSHTVYKQKENMKGLEDQIVRLKRENETANENLSSSQTDHRKHLQEKLDTSNSMLSSVFGEEEDMDVIEDSQVMSNKE